ncbi:MAG: hypothetical protein ABRQ23_06940, partial [Syntrophomonadaceae bacterium]
KKAIAIDEAGIRKVKENLKKVTPIKRPKKRSSLQAHITDLLSGMSKKDIENVIEDLFIEKIVYEENGIIKYALE